MGSLRRSAHIHKYNNRQCRRKRCTPGYGDFPVMVDWKLHRVREGDRMQQCEVTPLRLQGHVRRAKLSIKSRNISIQNFPKPVFGGDALLLFLGARIYAASMMRWDRSDVRRLLYAHRGFRLHGSITNKLKRGSGQKWRWYYDRVLLPSFVVNNNIPPCLFCSCKSSPATHTNDLFQWRNR